MNLLDLRKIGARLLSELKTTRLRPFSSAPLRKGASGDKTFPIDQQAEDIVITSLKDLREPLSIVSEECGVIDCLGGGPTVIVDPLDGSRNAVTGIPVYCTSIAVATGRNVGSVMMGYVINLLTGDEFWAEKGEGAFFNGLPVRTQQDDLFYLIAYEAQLPSRDLPVILPLLRHARRTRCLGATALDLAYVAYGAVSVFANPAPSRPLDFAAGYLLVKEAGGVFTDLTGGPVEDVPLSLDGRSPLLASGNPRLHDKAIKTLVPE